MAKQNPQTKAGDIFAIPIDEGRVGYGHVLLHEVASYPLYVAVFRAIWAADSPPPVAEIVSSEVALLGGTMDAFIWHGSWPIVANSSPDLQRFPWPHFICGPSERCHVEDFHGRVIRCATPEDQSFYPLRFTRAPIAYESTLRAIHGIGPWPAKHDKITYEYVLSRAAEHPTPKVA
ncbi:MAG: Imm26 family immunity protein [Chthoniobacter sp.]|uniref:Imm26 family immunity protein n=1 Tax=Chthoniobacter sp. TaxID=2510640 RepID=UPI0032A16E2B